MTQAGGGSGKQAPGPAAAGGKAPPPAPAVALPPPRWRDVWQLPALVLAGVLLLSGVAALIITKPKPNVDKMLDRAALLLKEQEFEPAIDYLNTEILPFSRGGAFSPEQTRAFHTLMGEAIYRAQKAKNLDREENNRTIVNEFITAERANAELTPTQIYFLADTYVSLGENDKALERIAAFPKEDSKRRNELVRKMVDRALADRKGDIEQAMMLLSELLVSSDLPLEDRVWATARQAEIRIAKGYYEEAVTRLLRSIQGLTAAPAADLGELFLLLGRAYMEQGRRASRDGTLQAEALKQLQRASDMLPESDARRAEAMLLIAELDTEKGDLAAAREKYQDIIANFVGEKPHLPALFGMAEVEAGMERFEPSLDLYAQVIAELKKPEAASRRDITADAVGQSLLKRFRNRFDAKDTRTARRFAILAEDLWGIDAAPPELLISLARANRTLAEDMLASASGGGVPDRSPGSQAVMQYDLSSVDPATRSEARKFLIEAGQYYRLHATSMVEDDKQYADSLWMAADSFDLAGDIDGSVASFNEYVNGFPSDPRHAEAKFRLAQAYQVRGDFDLAAGLYRELIDEKGDQGVGRGSGPFGDASYVPLALTYLRDPNPENDADAERLLETVVAGGVSGLDTLNFRDALIELGRYYYRSGREPKGKGFARAIEVLDQFIRRFPTDPRAGEARYQLADSLRLEAKAIEAKLQEAMPDRERAPLEDARASHLQRAIGLFAQVVDEFGAVDQVRLSDRDAIMRRNAAFYMGDCAFDLRDFASAIRYYDAAREAFPKDPASLVAMVQIVNAYLEQGDTKRAITANERARRFYQSLPPEVWDDPNLPMTRRDWERWLDSSAELARLSAQQNESRGEAAAGQEMR